MKEKESRTMDKVLKIVAVFLITFVIVMIVVYCVTGGIPDTLCTCVFAACTGELSIMGWIKTTKERHKERQYELEDRTYEDRKENET